MNILIKKVIGEDADTFMGGAGDRGIPIDSTPEDAGHKENFETPDEKREVQIANHIMFAANKGDMQTIIKLAQELHDMHSLGTKAEGGM